MACVTPLGWDLDIPFLTTTTQRRMTLKAVCFVGNSVADDSIAAEAVRDNKASARIRTTVEPRVYFSLYPFHIFRS